MIKQKIESVKIKSFLIDKQIESVNYQMLLSSNVKIQSTFHVLFLKSADLKKSLQKIFYYETQEKNEYEIKQILNHQRNPNKKNKLKYFIH